MPSSKADKAEKVYTTTIPVTAAGRVWLPGQPITSTAALARIEDSKLEELQVDTSSADRAEADGQPWYDERTVKSVLAGVGDDKDRAKYALDRENERPEDRRREGVLAPLAALVSGK